MMFYQEKELPNDSGRPLSYKILPIKNKIAVIMKKKYEYAQFVD